MRTLPSFTGALAASSLQSDARRAALLLHALHEVDQAWILDNLETSQRALLSTLLDELRQLGLSADQSLVDEAIRAASASAPSSRIGDPGEKALEQAEASVLARMLASEPPALIVRLLRLRSWRWTEAMLSQLHPMQQDKVREILADVKLHACHSSTRLDLKLLKHVQKRLEQASRSDAAQPANEAVNATVRIGSIWSRVLGRRFS